MLGVTALDVHCAQQLSRSADRGEMTEDRARTSEGGKEVRKTIIIDRSPEEVYSFWHDFSNLPSFMRHLESVQTTGGNRSHWKAKGPAGKTVEWDAEVTDDQPNSDRVALASEDRMSRLRNRTLRAGSGWAGHASQSGIELFPSGRRHRCNCR